VFPFTSTSEELEFRDAVRDFASREIAPIALQHDRSGESPIDVHQRFWREGFAETLLPRPDAIRSPYLVRFCIAAEELAYACAAIASLIMLPLFFNRLVLELLTEPARSEFRAQLSSNPTITSFAATEQASGSDLMLMGARAERVDGGYVLNGRKQFSTNLRHASRVIVVARTGASDERAASAMTWLLVPTADRGLAIGDRWDTLGLRAIDVSPLELHDARIPESGRLGAEGRGIWLMNEALPQSRTGIGAIAVGIARRARDEVLAYGSKRRLYGDKLYKLQDYRFRIAEMEKDIAAARALTYLSAMKYDQGLPNNKEASIAKLNAGQVVMRVTEAASVMFGGIGYTSQSVVEKLFRDARHVAIVEGTDPTHKELIFADLIRKGGY
jgi:alkylation response protein AidB-like acyl-CoA dehydrogenase